MPVTLTPYGQALHDGLAPLADTEQDEALTKLVDAMAVPFNDGAYIRGLGDDTQIPYQRAMSVADAPSWVLPWLAQFVGVKIPVGTDDATARAMIIARANQRRGRPQTIIDAVKPYLYGTKSVTLQEQTGGNPFQFTVFTNAYGTPYSEQTLTNLMTNPSFEVDTSGWTTTGNPLARVTSDAKFGSASLQTNAFSVTGWNASSPACATPSGGIYTASVWIKTTVTRTVQMNIQSSTLTLAVTASCPAGVWTKIEKSFLPEATSTSVKLVISTSSSSAGETALIDGAMVLNRPTGDYFDMQSHVTTTFTPPGGYVPGYFDGSFAGAAWTGTANASSSTLAPTTHVIKDAITAVKPAAFTFSLVPSAGLAWDAATGNWDAALGTWDNPGSPPA